MTLVLSSDESIKQYELLIHSLTHEHTKQYIDRHQLLYEKWCRDYTDGFYIRDINYITKLFEILRDRCQTHRSMFLPILFDILKICSKPLFEVKANERLRAPGIAKQHSYYIEVAKFYNEDDVDIKIEVTRCFRCIINGGIDPTILRSEIIPWENDGLRVQVTDKMFIQKLIRDSDALKMISSEFLDNVEKYYYDATEFALITNKEEKKSNNNEQKSNGNDSDDDVRPSTMPTIQGSDETKDDKKTSSDDQEVFKFKLSKSQELCYIMLSLTIDLSADEKTAVNICKFKANNAIMRLLKVSSSESIRHPKVSVLVNLMWTLLEAYLNYNKTISKTFETSEERDYANKAMIEYDVMDFEFAVNVLKVILLELIMDGYRTADKECRNEITVVLIMIAKFPAAFPVFMNSGLFNVLVTYACLAESGQKGWYQYTLPLAKFRNFGTPFDVDLQLKRLLWMLISDLLVFDDPDSLLCIGASPIISTMLTYGEFDTNEHHKHSEEEKFGLLSPTREGSAVNLGGGNNKLEDSFMLPQSLGADSSSMALGTNANINKSAADDNTNNQTSLAVSHKEVKKNAFLLSVPMSQLRELQGLAMSFLAQNVGKVMGEFLRINGPIRILDILFLYCKSSIPEHRDMIYYSVLLLSRCIMWSNVVRYLMERENAIQTLLFILEHNPDEKTRSQTARVIGMLCMNNNVQCQHQFRAQDGIGLLIRILHNYTEFRKPLVGRKAGVKLSLKGDSEIDDPSEDPKGGDVPILIVAVVDCILLSIVGNVKSEARFAKEEGIDALLNLIEVSSYTLRTQVLRVFCDLIENQRLLPFIHAWRGPKSARSGAQLIAHCWLDEEVRMDSKRQQGVFANIFDCLGNHDWPLDNITQLKGESLSSASMTEFGPSLAVTKLANAILASKGIVEGNVEIDVRANVLGADTRCVISRTMELMGLFESDSYPTLNIDTKKKTNNDVDILDLENNEYNEEDYEEDEAKALPVLAATGSLGLTPTDKQAIAIARHYRLLRAGQYWKLVADELEQEGIKPIEADLAMIETFLESYFDATQSIQLQQMEFQSEENKFKRSVEDMYLDQIITKKNQQIRSEWLKRNAGHRTHAKTT